MQTFLISYDLKTSNDDNAAVRANLERIGATMLLESVWTYVADMTKSQVAEKVSTGMKNGDKFIVAEIKSEHLLQAVVPFSHNKYVEKIMKNVKFDDQ
ncbi:hypothetical protein ACTU9R_31460 [Burkholderia gladioli]|uniref:hypothetical protein n=1 Tax=Burkholderia gladioli TaxID=28095 RepID=UPI00163F450D|nr:hypothetical protein [Burkholderia gladioli]